MKLIISLLLSFVLAGMPTKWNLDFEQAKKEATQSKKMILLNFGGSDWCIPCIKLKKDVFESTTFQSYATNKLILVKADFPRLAKNKLSAQQMAHNEKLAEKYNPDGKFPYTLLLDAQGNKLKEWDGYPKGLTPQKMAEEIEKLVKK